MSKTEKIDKAQSLLQQALHAVADAMPHNPNVNEARNLIRQAISKLENTSHKVGRRQSERSAYDEWWKDVTAGTAAQPMSPTAQVRGLAALDAMIAEEQQKIDELDTASQQPDGPNELLSD